ncbi:MAG: S1 family peptidase [Proteobacteria bacterium]|nr:S1 family peptidase [Pseudomonadota bacterium]
MKQILRVTLCLITSLFILSGCGKSLSEAELPRPSSRTAMATQGFPGIVMITGQKLCTGTFVSPSTILTAAHCLLDAGPFTVHTTRGPIQTTQKVTLGSGAEGDPFDVALLYLPSPVASPQEIIPVASGASVGDAVTLVGFGCSSSEIPASGGIKRLGSNIIAERSEFLEVATPGIQIKQIAGPENRAGACFGDSGGPLLKKVGELFMVIGVSHGAYNEGSRQMSQFVDFSQPSVRNFLSTYIR